MVFAGACCFISVPAMPSFRLTERQSNLRLAKARRNQLLHFEAPKSPSRINAQQKICECFDMYQEQVPYEKAWSWQKAIVEQKKAQIEKNGHCTDTLIILQHPPVYTLGTASSEENLNFKIKDAPFDIYRTERGGEVTYHGPGQLVIYPIINLRNHKMDLHWYLRALEEVVIHALSSTFSIKASRLDGLTGVWVGDQKLAAIGIRTSQWITYHGLALNVTTDLTPFDWIVPCGIRNRGVGSVKQLLSKSQLSVGYGSTDLHHPDDSFLLNITHKSLLAEFSEIFHVEYHHKTMHTQELFEMKREANLPR